MSILFADLVGFTALSEQRDPEDVRELLARYFETASGIVARYGGTVEKFIGDAVVAVWGTRSRTRTMPSGRCGPRSTWSRPSPRSVTGRARTLRARRRAHRRGSRHARAHGPGHGRR